MDGDGAVFPIVRGLEIGDNLPDALAELADTVTDYAEEDDERSAH
jgi:hypothetical protein